MQFSGPVSCRQSAKTHAIRRGSEHADQEPREVAPPYLHLADMASQPAPEFSRATEGLEVGDFHSARHLSHI